LVDNNVCKKHNLSLGVFSLGGARIAVPLVGKRETSGFAGLREQAILQTNTQRRVELNCSEINKQPISFVEPTNRIGLICIAQDAADLNWPRYLTDERQRDYPRPNGYGNRHRNYLGNRIRASRTNFGRTQNYCSRNNSFAQNVRRYSTNGVRASKTIFSSSINNVRTQNSYSRNNSFAQTDRKVNVENQHHQNHSESPASEPVIEHIDDEFKVKVTNTNIYNDYGDLVKFSRDVLIERLSYILPPDVSSGLHI